MPPLPPVRDRHLGAGKFHRTAAIALIVLVSFQVVQHVWLANSVEPPDGRRTLEGAAPRGPILQKEGEGNLHVDEVDRDGPPDQGEPRRAGEDAQTLRSSTQGHAEIFTKLSSSSPSSSSSSSYSGDRAAPVQTRAGPEFLERRLCDETEWCITSRTRRDIALETREWDALCLEPDANDPDPPPISGVSPYLGSRPFLDWRDLILQANTSAHHYPRRPSSFPHCIEKGMRPVSFVYGWNESMAMMRARIRCGCPFSVIRFGDGELAILRNESYVCPEFRIDKGHPNSSRLSRSIMDGILLSSDSDWRRTGHHILVGLPFYFCREGMAESKRTRRAYRYGGGGRASLVKGYLELLADSDGRSKAAPNRGLVYSWQWGNLNHPGAASLLRMIHSSGWPMVAVCNQGWAPPDGTGKIPPWMSFALTVPTDAVRNWLLESIEEVKSEARALAESVSHHAFVFSAGPISKVLIPVMARSNPSNIYLDYGGSLGSEFGVAGRDFISSHWVRAGGALQRNQVCTETRWAIQADQAGRLAAHPV